MRSARNAASRACVAWTSSSCRCAVNDVAAVLDLINDMAAEIGTQDRIMPLETYDQTVIVIVGPGKSLIAAAADGLLLPADATASMERGKAFEEEVRRRYRIDVE